MKTVLTTLLGLLLAVGALSNVYAVSYNYTSFSYPGQTNTQPAGINDAGTIVGFYAAANDVNYAFSLSNGIYSTLTGPTGTSLAPCATPTARRWRTAPRRSSSE